jgi:hypothetical protein
VRHYHVVEMQFKLLAVDSVQEFKIKVKEQGRNCELAYCLDEGLANTDPLATKERTEAKRVAGRASWSQKIRALRVKALRDELFGLNPLVWVVSESEHVDREE